MSDDQRLWMVKVLISIGMACGLWMARRAWTTPRDCPRVPVASFFRAQLPESTLFQILLILLAVTLVSTNPTLPILAFVPLAVGLCCFDWTRFRPWIYQNCTILSIIALFHCGHAGEGLNICRLTTVSIYFWAGLLKFNSTFFSHLFPYFLAPLLNKIPQPAYQKLSSFLSLAPGDRNQALSRYVAIFARAVPVIEAAFAIGLLFPATRTLAIFSAVFMHCFILTWIWAVGPQTCPTIGPWNFCMMLTTVTLFWGSGSQGCWDILVGQQSITHLLVLGVFFLLPTLGLLNLLDPVFSHAHWSGRHVYGSLTLSRGLFQKIPASVQRYCKPMEQVYVLEIAEWFLFELGVPAVQQERLLVAVAKDFQRYQPQDWELSLTVTRLYTARPSELACKYYTAAEIWCH